MNSHYEIIKDEQQLRKFINWLPELEGNETYYVGLLARNKYCSGINHIKSDVQQYGRHYAKKEHLFDKINRFSVPVGSYKQGDVEIPQEALAVYINPNPRDIKKAAATMLKELADKITKDFDGYNIGSMAMTTLQKSRGTKHFVDWDFDDFTLEGIYDGVFDKLVNKSACTLISTRGGFHLLVNPALVETKYRKSWYIDLIEFRNDKEPVGDMLMPVPGCVQGNFTPVLTMINGIDQ